MKDAFRFLFFLGQVLVFSLLGLFISLITLSVFVDMLTHASF